MSKRAGWIVLAVAGALAAGLCCGFLGIKKEKVSAGDKQSSGMPFPVMMNQLSRNTVLWDRMGEEEKKRAVEAVIGLYRGRDNAAILNSREFYVGKIDETLRMNPPVQNVDIMTLVRILAIMEYDFYNGENKDDLARKTLGEKGFLENQTRRQMKPRASVP